MRSNVVESLIGAFVLVVAAYFFHYAYTASGSKVVYGTTYLAKFDRIDGLVEGNDVKLSGVKVGDVHKIEIDPKTYLAVVHLSVDGDLHLPMDSSAQVVSESLMGGKYVALVPGADDDMLKSGDTIVNTQSSISFEGLIGKYLFSQNEEKKDTKSSS